MKIEKERFIRLDSQLKGEKAWYFTGKSKPTKTAVKKLIAKHKRFCGPELEHKYRAYLITITTTREPVEI